MERHADRASEAKDERDRLVKAIEETQGQVQDGERMTFSKLDELAESSFYRPAIIVEGRKLRNTVRSHKTAHGQLDVLSQFFGKRFIQQITKESLDDYKLWRLRTGSRHPTARGEGKWKPVKLATINRELSRSSTYITIYWF